jgi:hypothetical protein
MKAAKPMSNEKEPGMRRGSERARGAGILMALSAALLLGCRGQVQAAELKQPATLLPRAHWASITSVALSGDGKRVLTGSVDQTARLWDVGSGKTIRTFAGHTAFVDAVALSGDGKRVLTGTWGEARLWDAETGKTIRIFSGHAGFVVSAVLSGDGKRVLTGSGDEARLWDAESSKTLQTFSGHTGSVTSVALSRDGKRIFTGSQDGTVRLWTPGRKAPVFSFLPAGEEWIFWTPEGYYTCSPNGENLIAWKIEDKDALYGYRIVGPEQFRKHFYPPDLFRLLLSEVDLAKALAKADKDRGGKTTPTSLAKALPPNVDLRKPDKDGDIDTEPLTVEGVAFSVGDHPVKRMRLLVNGRDYDGKRSTFVVPKPKLGKVTRTWQVELEPDPEPYTIQVLADNTLGVVGRSDVVRIRRKPLKETRPRLFVLAIGVSEYEKEDLRKGVYYCAADARKFADTIEKSSKPLYRQVVVEKLIDKDATRKKILRALARLRKEATQRDAVMIFFAGHGKRDEQTRFFFLPVEADLGELRSNCLSEADFKDEIKGLPGKVILFLDACHSGALIENSRSVDGLTDQLYRDLTSQEYGLVMMCSSRGLEESKESSKHESGYFTLALVEGLLGKARKTKECVVYLEALDEYVTKRVKELSDGNQHPLTKQPSSITNIALTKP